MPVRIDALRLRRRDGSGSADGSADGSAEGSAADAVSLLFDSFPRLLGFGRLAIIT